MRYWEALTQPQEDVDHWISWKMYLSWGFILHICCAVINLEYCPPFPSMLCLSHIQPVYGSLYKRIVLKKKTGLKAI